jgi:hypothetical protein
MSVKEPLEIPPVLMGGILQTRFQPHVIAHRKGASNEMANPKNTKASRRLT